MLKSTLSRCTIILIPKGNLPMVEYELTPKIIAIGVGIVSWILIAATATFWGLYQCRTAYLETEHKRVELAEFQQERSSLLAKIASLETAINRTARLTSKVESLGERKAQIAQRGLVGDLVEKMSWRAPKHLSTEKLLAMASKAEKKLNEAFLKQQDRLFFWSSAPSIWPTQGWVSSKFGWRRSFITRTGGRASSWHKGIDIAAPIGTRIEATADGLVTYTGYRSGYGKTVEIDHGNGITTLYAHCSRLLVKEGQEVTRGMKIAAVGNTGRSTGPHLHYEIRVNGVAKDPLKFLVN